MSGHLSKLYLSHKTGLHTEKEKLWPKWDLKFKYPATDFVLMHDLCWHQLSKDQWCVFTYCAPTQKRQSSKDYWDYSLTIPIMHLPMHAKAGMNDVISHVGSIFSANKFAALVTFGGINIINVSGEKGKINSIFYCGLVKQFNVCVQNL